MRRRADGERGAVLVEVALVVPLLLALVLGIIELGFVSQRQQQVVAATRSATRVASSAGDDRLADYEVLLAVEAALDDVDAADVERIIVFKALAGGALPPGCETGPVNGWCNHYDGSAFAYDPISFSTTSGTCSTSAPDHYWCPLDRSRDLFAGTDWLGVRVEVRHHENTTFLGERLLTDTSVMRVEPRFD